jgi:hypothetical protein
MSLLKIGKIKNLENHRVVIGESNNNAPSYIFSNTIDTDVYNDVTSNKNWIELGKYQYDYLFCRNQIMMWTPNYVNKEGGIGWSGLTLEEKQIAAKNFAVGGSERAEVYTDDELRGFWSDFIDKAKESRIKRWESAKSLASYQLSVPNSIDLAKTTNDLSNEYITYGIEEYSIDGVDGLFNWLEGTGPTYSGGTGFQSKSYYSSGLTQSLMTILRDGIY